MGHDSGRTVSFTFKTADEKRDYEEYAASKGMTLAGLSKMALYQYRAKYGVKIPSKRPAKAKPEDAKTVQFLAVGEASSDSR